MSRRPTPPEVAIPVTCPLVKAGLSWVTAAVADGADGPSGAPDAALRAAVTALLGQGTLAAMAEGGAHVDVLTRRGDDGRLARALPHLRFARAAAAEPSTSVIASCIESSLRHALVARHGWTPFTFGGGKWLVRGLDGSSALTSPLRQPPLFDCVSLRFRATSAGSEHGVALLRGYPTKLRRKDVVDALPAKLRPALLQQGSVDLQELMAFDTFEPEDYEQLTVATLPRLTAGVIKWVGTDLPPGDSRGVDWYRKHWYDQYGISLPEQIDYWVSVQFKGRGREDARTYPACTLFRVSGGDQHGFGATLPPQHSAFRQGGGPAQREMEERLFTDLAKISLLGGRGPAVARAPGGGAGLAAGPSTDTFQAHVPAFVTMKAMKESGRAAAPVSTQAKPLFQSAASRLAHDDDKDSSSEPESESESESDDEDKHQLPVTPHARVQVSAHSILVVLAHTANGVAAFSAQAGKRPSPMPAAASAAPKRPNIGGGSARGGAPIQPQPRPRTKQPGARAGKPAAPRQQLSAAPRQTPPISACIRSCESHSTCGLGQAGCLCAAGFRLRRGRRFRRTAAAAVRPFRFLNSSEVGPETRVVSAAKALRASAA